jgi:hypothetical protein
MIPFTLPLLTETGSDGAFYGCPPVRRNLLKSVSALARKRTGDAEIGWRPAPEKNVETMPCW